MRKSRWTAALLLACWLLAGAARADVYRAAEENIPRFRELFRVLAAACEEPSPGDGEAIREAVEAIRQENADDGDIAEAVAGHWTAVFLDRNYRMFIHRGEEKATALERSGLDFGGKHAFVVLGYRLEYGEMTEELKGRCDAAAAAARSFPDSILI